MKKYTELHKFDTPSKAPYDEPLLNETKFSKEEIDKAKGKKIKISFR